MKLQVFPQQPQLGRHLGQSYCEFTSQGQLRNQGTLVSCLRNKITISDGGSTGKGIGLTGLSCSRRKNLQASYAPASDDGVDPSRVKQRIFMACRE